MNKIISTIALVTLVFLTPGCPTGDRSSPLVSVYLVGTGVVGGALLDQIEKNHDAILEEQGVDIRIIGIASSKSMIFARDGVGLKGWKNALEQTGTPMSWQNYLGQVVQSKLPNPIFVDCTSNQEIADAYPLILEAQVSVVTPNKKANSGSLALYKKIHALASTSKARFFYDSNVGAGLPVLSTINGLKKSKDTVVKVEGILSGTLSYLFNSFVDGTNFSELVRDAQKKGYTEPDPRDDLNGMDVARKLLIIAREAGFDLEMGDIELQQFLPKDCFAASSVAEFYEKLAKQDVTLTTMRKQAESQGKRLKFIATLENGKGKIALQALGQDHPFFHLSGNDNIVAISTNYYQKNPLVIRGPGAGADVTAAKVLEGIVRAAR